MPGTIFNNTGDRLPGRRDDGQVYRITDLLYIPVTLQSHDFLGKRIDRVDFPRISECHHVFDQVETSLACFTTHPYDRHRFRIHECVQRMIS